ncbi:E3 ubiquitin-protein ligase XB3-like isoform X4 [Tasmannia lanceolata]|uniref:E3 ubiquitin-protein ligase XB3-like isoform X4 n=1 Tax=Tasmannia lanceolata TaxID=3420 RepID=UPI004063F029
MNKSVDLRVSYYGELTKVGLLNVDGYTNSLLSFIFEELVKKLEPADDVGPALQFLNFCSAFGKVLSMILDKSVHPDVLNHRKQIPLMLAAMHRKICCVRKLLQADFDV